MVSYVSLRVSFEKLVLATHRANLTGNQVAQLSIPTSGGNDVFAWLITPLKLYAKHEAAFRHFNPPTESKQTLAVEKLTEDPQGRLIIYCKSFESR